MANAALKIKLNSFDDLFHAEEDIRKIVKLPVSEIHGFKNHPFKVELDSDMEELIESISENGLIEPIRVRIDPEGGYEVYSGHRRLFACISLGFSEIDAIIDNLNDKDAVIFMVDSNLKREKLLYSELAFAFKMKQEALRSRTRPDKGKRTTDMIGETDSISGRQVERYIALTNLEPALLEMVDEEKIKFTAAVDLSFISKHGQNQLLEFIEDYQIYPDGKAAKQLKDMDKMIPLEKIVIWGVLCEKQKKVQKFSLKTDISSFFDEGTTKEEMEGVIIDLLTKWKMDQR